MADVRFEHVEIRYPGTDTATVPDMDLHITDGEFLVLVGPSGCGKSTTLRALAGLEDTTGGKISIGGRDVTGTEPGERDIAMVFQDYALYPHMTVAENMGFALKVAKRPKAEIAERVQRAAEILGIEEFLTRKPKDLSGGQRQRVAMGRAIVREPQVFLMDEPLSNLDAKLRVQTRAQIVKLQRELGVTTVYVTHDQVEAMTMGDRVAVLNKGVLQQVDSPKKLYEEPVNAFVASFIGSPAMNLLRVARSELPQLGGWGLAAPDGLAAPTDAASAEIIVGIRPESFDVHASGDGLPGTVSMIEELGADSYIYLDTEYGQVAARGSNSAQSPALGDPVLLRPREGTHIHYFDGHTELRL